MNTLVQKNSRQLSKAQAVGILCVCIAGSAVIGGAACFLSGISGTAAKVPLVPNGIICGSLWTVCYSFLGLGLYLSITAEIRTCIQRKVRLWSLTLWGTVFILGIVWPFLMYAARVYMTAFVWQLIIVAISVSLITINFRLRPAAAFMIMPFAVFSIFMSYAAFYVALYI